MKRSILFTGFLFTVYSLFSQNIGIGTNNPTEKLHIAGNIKVDTLKPVPLRSGETLDWAKY